MDGKSSERQSQYSTLSRVKAKPKKEAIIVVAPPNHRTGSPNYVRRVKNLPIEVKLPEGYVLGENGVIYDQNEDFQRVGRLKGWDAKTKTYDPGRARPPPMVPEGVVVNQQANKQRTGRASIISPALNTGVRLQVVKEGWLFKQGERGLKRFKKRYFRLYSSGRAAYSLSSSDLEPIKIIPLGGATIKLRERTGPHDHVFTVTPILKHHRVFVLAAETATLLEEWYTAFRSVDASTIKLFPSSAKEGYLRKLGHINKSWKMRYFVLLPDRLEYYEDRTASKPIKWIDLSKNFKIQLIDHRKEFVFEVTPAGGASGASQRTFSLKAGNEANRTEWLTALRALNSARQSPWKGKGTSPSPS